MPKVPGFNTFKDGIISAKTQLSVCKPWRRHQGRRDFCAHLFSISGALALFGVPHGFVALLKVL